MTFQVPPDASSRLCMWLDGRRIPYKFGSRIWGGGEWSDCLIVDVDDSEVAAYIDGFIAGYEHGQK